MPPKKSKGNDSEDANIGEEDQADLAKNVSQL